jgi:hypothetical protein
MNKKSKYILITRSTSGSANLYGNSLRNMQRTGRFIFKHCTPVSVCLVNLKGKVGLYLVTGKPEKTELRGAKAMK